MEDMGGARTLGCGCRELCGELDQTQQGVQGWENPGSGVLCPDITCPKTCSLTDLIQVTKSPCPQNTAN